MAGFGDELFSSVLVGTLDVVEQRDERSCFDWRSLLRNQRDNGWKQVLSADSASLITRKTAYVFLGIFPILASTSCLGLDFPDT